MTDRPRADSATQMPIFVLTLEGDEARRAPLISALEAWGLRYELFFGVDGRAGLPGAYEDQIDRDKAAAKLRRPMSDGEFACALSHMEIYREMKRRNLDSALLLEDDAIPQARFRDFAYLGPKGADLLLLDHSHAHVWGKPMSILPGVAARRLSVTASLGTGYWISGNAAAWIVEHGIPITNIADWPDCVSKLQVRALEPRLVDHPHEEQAASHLRSGRYKTRSDPKRFLRVVFWRTWLRKRLSSRIS